MRSASPLEALGAGYLVGKELNGDGDTLKAWTPYGERSLGIHGCL